MSRARIYALEAKCEFLKVLRLPMYAIPTLAFPLVFYLLFGVALGNRTAGGTPMAAYLLASYGAFGVLGAALFGFGVGVATERGQGWMLFKRATPMPPLAPLVGKLAMVIAFGTTIVGGLFLLGATVAGVRLPAGQWLALAPVLIAGAVPFGAFGLALGFLIGPNSAPAVVNLLYLPLAFASGMWIPIQVLPGFFQKLAPWLPTYHYAQLALGIIGADAGGRPAVHAAVLVVFTGVCLAVARLGVWRDEGRTWG